MLDRAAARSRRALLAIYNEEFGLPRSRARARARRSSAASTASNDVRRCARHGDEVMRVPIDFLTGGVRYERPYEPRRHGGDADAGCAPARGMASARVGVARARCARARASRRLFAAPIYERYDGVVRGTTSIPRGRCRRGRDRADPGRAARRSRSSVAGNPRYGAIDPRRAAELAVLRSGAQRLRGRCDARGPDRLLELRQSRGCPAVRAVRRRGRRAGAALRANSACRSSPGTSVSTTSRRPATRFRRRRSSPASGRSQDVSRAVDAARSSAPGSALYRFGGVTTDRLGRFGLRRSSLGISRRQRCRRSPTRRCARRCRVMHAAFERGLCWRPPASATAASSSRSQRWRSRRWAPTPIGRRTRSARSGSGRSRSGRPRLRSRGRCRVSRALRDAGLRDDGVTRSVRGSRRSRPRGRRIALRARRRRSASRRCGCATRERSNSTLYAAWSAPLATSTGTHRERSVVPSRWRARLSGHEQRGRDQARVRGGRARDGLVHWKRRAAPCGATTRSCCRGLRVRGSRAGRGDRGPRRVDGRRHASRRGGEAGARHLQRRAGAGRGRARSRDSDEDAGRPQAGFARNGPGGRFVCRRVYVKLAVAPERCDLHGAARRGALIPAWAVARRGPSGRAAESVLERIVARRPRRVRVLRRARRGGYPSGAQRVGARRRRAHERRRQRARDHAAPRARRLDVHASRRSRNARQRGATRQAMLAPSGGIAAVRRASRRRCREPSCIDVSADDPGQRGVDRARDAAPARRRRRRLERADVWRLTSTPRPPTALVDAVRGDRDDLQPQQARARSVREAREPQAGRGLDRRAGDGRAVRRRRRADRRPAPRRASIASSVHGVAPARPPRRPGRAARSSTARSKRFSAILRFKEQYDE